TWTATGSLATAREDHTATLLNKGNVLVAGGYDYPAGSLASAELYTSPDATNTCVPPPAGLVSWWSGDKTADDVQGTNPGVLKNGASYGRGISGPGFSFDGVDDGVRIPNSSSLSQIRI